MVSTFMVCFRTVTRGVEAVTMVGILIRNPVRPVIIPSVLSEFAMYGH
jgi:hypothetical protein